ncbi:MAG: hypothetical protein V3U80_07265 [Flavobacteriaceae bacterium]
MKKCKICRKSVKGRSDKKYCSVACKSKYHKKLRNYTTSKTAKIDKILHRNYAILTEVLSTNRKQIKLNRIILEQKNFQFNYHTHQLVNSKGKTYHYLYNLAWMTFSDNQVMIIRTKI